MKDLVDRLFPYQRRGVRFLVERRRAYLADHMGLGKTVQALTAARLLRRRDRVMVLCPAVAVPNWYRLAEEWAPDLVSRLEVLSYNTRDLPAPRDYGLTILDEAHYLKSIGAQRTRRAFGFAMRTPYAWALSGTPAPNHAGELYTVARAFWPEQVREWGISNYRGWLNKFCHYENTPWGIRVRGVKNAHLLRAWLSRVMQRVTLSNARLDLPPLRVDVEYLPKPAVHAAKLDEIETRIAQLEGDPDSSSSELRHMLGLYKAPLIAERIALELEQNRYDKIVVLAYHLDVISLLWERLSEYGATGFTGQHKQRERSIAIDRFMTDPKVRVFIGQQNAAGIAIDLFAAHEIVLVEPAWSPDDNAQGIKRIHRIGQEHPCRARIFAIDGTLDVAVMRTVANKTRMQAEVGL